MRKMKPIALCLAFSGLLFPAAQSAFANPTLIATLNGYYGQYANDTPELTIANTSGYNFTNAQLTLTGYQGINIGIQQTQGIPDVPNGSMGTNYLYNWSGPLTAGNLFAFDYDDEYPSNSHPANAACTINDNIYGQTQYYWCADVGNFYVTFTATLSGAGALNGQSIYAQFSPGEDPLGIGNAACPTDAAGCFVGWEGLDPNGWSESGQDDHNPGGPNGVLANIYLGTAPPVGNTPEPSSLVLLGSGIVGLAGAARKRLVRS